MVLDNFKKYISCVLGGFGILANTLGLVNAFYRHNGLGSIIPTLLGLTALIILFVISIKKESYGFFITAASVMTGMIFFPMTFLGTRNPSTFLLYTFLLPASYGIGVKNFKSFILPIINCILLDGCIVYRIDWNYCFIYTMIYTYSFSVTALFAMALSSYTDNVQTENKKYRKMAERDELTRLYNRHSLQSIIDKGEEWIPIMMDIDHFKQVNDIYGHDEGDCVLQQFASILLRFSNDNFMVFRYGGEEFLILSKMSEVSTDIRVKELFETVRRELHTSDRKPRTISVGIGRKSKIDNGAIKRADINLYICKNNGRNCIAKNNKIFFS